MQLFNCSYTSQNDSFIVNLWFIALFLPPFITAQEFLIVAFDHQFDFLILAISFIIQRFLNY